MMRGSSRLNAFVGLVAGLLCCLLTSGRESATTRPVPFEGASLPEPPQQKVAWTAPQQTTLPERLIGAADLLFAHGMADPRGGEYRQIEVAVGNVWNGGGQTVATHDG